METRRIFVNGGSQAIRLPRSMRFADDQQFVSVRQEGERIIIEPVKCKKFSKEFWSTFGSVPDLERQPQTPAVNPWADNASDHAKT